MQRSFEDHAVRLFGLWRAAKRRVRRFVVSAILPVFLLAGGALMVYGVVDVFQFGQEKSLTIQVLRVEPGADGLSPYGHVATYLTAALKADSVLVNGESGLVVRIEQRDTRGSFHALTLVEEAASEHPDSMIRIGIVQSDVLYHYTHGQHPQFFTTHESAETRSVARLLHEWLHVLTTTKVTKSDVRGYLRSASNEPILRADQVCSGEVGSGHLVTALNVARVLQASWASSHDCGAPNEFGTDSGPTFALRVVSPPPAIRAEEARGDTVNIGLDPLSVSLLAEAFPGVYGTVGDSAINMRYPGTEAFADLGRATISLDAVLVTARRAPDDVVRAIWRALDRLEVTRCIDNTANVSPSMASWRDSVVAEVPVDLNPWMDSVTTLSSFCDLATPLEMRLGNSGSTVLPLPSGSETRVRDLPIAEHQSNIVDRLDGWLSKKLARWVKFHTLRGLLTGLLGFAMLGPVVLLFKRSWTADELVSQLRVKRWFTAALVFLTFHLVIAVLLWLGELNSQHVLVDGAFVAGGIKAALTSVLTFVTLGDFGIEFRSHLSVVGVGLLKTGWGLAGVAIGFQTLERIKRVAKEAPMKDHVIVIGTNDRTQRVTEELRNHFALGEEKGDYRVIGFTEAFGDLDTVQNGLYEKVSTLEEAVASARLDIASSVIALPDKLQAKMDGDADVDLWVCRLVREIRRKGEGKQFHLVAEVKRPRNVELAKLAGADEVICVSEFGAELVAHASSRPGVSTAYSHLLETGSESSEVYYDRIDRHSKTWKTFSAARMGYAEKHSQQEPRIPIGIRRQTDRGKYQLLMNPVGEEEIRDRDELVVIAYKPRRIF